MKLRYYFFATLGMTNLASAQPVVELVSYGTAQTGSISPLSTNPSLTVDFITAGSGIAPTSGAATFNYRDWDNVDFDSAVAASEFWKWGFTVSDTTKTVQLSQLQIRLDRSNTGPPGFAILCEVFKDGNSTMKDFSQKIVSVSDLGVNGQVYTVDLRAVPLLDGNDTVQFTLAAFGASNKNLGSFDLEVLTATASEALLISGSVDIASSAPSTSPSSQPITLPSSQPSISPSIRPSTLPSRRPSASPSSQPSKLPSRRPSTSPSSKPSISPSSSPSKSSKPSSQPSSAPSGAPSSEDDRDCVVVNNCGTIDFYCRLICLVLTILRFLTGG